MDSRDKQRQRELERRRENEEKDREVERNVGQRPLEGLAGGHTTWTAEQDDAQREQTHGEDEARSRRRSGAQIPPERER